MRTPRIVTSSAVTAARVCPPRNRVGLTSTEGGICLVAGRLALLFTLCFSCPAAAEPVVSVYYDGRGGFTLMGNQLNGVSELEVRLAYQSDEKTTPHVIGIGLGAQATLKAESDNAGSLLLLVKSGKPMSGSVPLATIARLRGTVTHLSAWLRNDKGIAETARVLISNPTDEQLSEMARRPNPRPVPALPARPAARPPTSDVAPPPPSATTAPVTHPQKGGAAPRPIAFNRRKSVRELFRDYAGERTQAALADLFRRNDDMFLQEPQVLLSDGSASLRLAIRTPGDPSPRFFIYNGNCTGLRIGEQGDWLLEIVPVRGSMAASVTVLSGEETIEFPLAIAPPLELFDQAGAEAGVAEYVDLANRLASRQNDKR